MIICLNTYIINNVHFFIFLVYSMSKRGELMNWTSAGRARVYRNSMKQSNKKKSGVKTNSNKKHTKKKYYKQTRKRSHKRNGLTKRKGTRRKRTGGGGETSALPSAHNAARRGQADLLADNFTLPQLNEKEYGVGHTPLWLAINYAKPEVVRTLLDRGVNVTYDDKEIAKISIDSHSPTVSNKFTTDIYNMIVLEIGKTRERDNKWVDVDWPQEPARKRRKYYV
jgi:hypothetical protein